MNHNQSFDMCVKSQDRHSSSQRMDFSTVTSGQGNILGIPLCLKVVCLKSL